MTYAQKLFLGYFSQNSMKIKTIFFGCFSLICSQGIVRELKKKIFNFYYFLILSFFFADFQKKLNFSKNKKSSFKFKKSPLLVCSLCQCDHFKPNPNKFGQS